jgi:hypothetical protein
LNPRTWVPKASTLPLDHRSRKRQSIQWKNAAVPGTSKAQISKSKIKSLAFFNLLVFSFNIYNKIREEAKNPTLKFYQLRENYSKNRRCLKPVWSLTQRQRTDSRREFGSAVIALKQV